MQARTIREAELRDIGESDPQRLRDLLLLRLDQAGGNADVAAKRIGVTRAAFDALRDLVNAEMRVSLPPSPAFRKWAQKVG